MKKKVKFRSPQINLDEMNLEVSAIDPLETAELFGLDPADFRPISEIAMKMAEQMKKGKTIPVCVNNRELVLTTRRLIMHDLRRLANFGTAPRCVEVKNELMFSYVATTWS